MPYKFDMDNFDKELIEKLAIKKAPTLPLMERLRQTARVRKPRLPK